MYPSIKICILGGGTEYKKISTQADKINQNINHKLIFTLGNVENPQQYFDKNTLFIGVARSAIEAMSCGAPTILLGNEGYLGLLNESNLKKAIKTNLTCRSCKNLPTPDLLYKEICRYFELSDEEKSCLSNLCRKTAVDFFSAEQMAKQTLDFYKQILQNHQNNTPTKNQQKVIKIALCGYYGRGNFGDEAILRQIKEKIKERAKKYSHSNRKVKIKICIIKNKNPLKIFHALNNADLFIFGGGSLLQNSTSDASLLYYIGIIILANIFSQRTIMLANGIGPFQIGIFSQKSLKALLSLAIGSFDLISARDLDSKITIKKLVPNRKVHLVFDPAWIYFKDKAPNINQQLMLKRRLIYIPNTRTLIKSGFSLQEVVTTIKSVCEKSNMELIVIPLSKNDFEKLKNETGAKHKILPAYSLSPQEFEKILKSCSFCITQRYHGALFSLSCGIPTLAISNDPKIKSLCKEFALLSPSKTVLLTNTPLLSSTIEKELSNHKANYKHRAKRINKYAETTDANLNKIFDIFI